MQTRKVDISAFTAHSRAHIIDIYIGAQNSDIGGLYVHGNYKLYKQGKRHYGQVLIQNKTIRRITIPKEHQITWAGPITSNISDQEDITDDVFYINDRHIPDNMGIVDEGHKNQADGNTEIQDKPYRQTTGLRHRLDHTNLEDPDIDETLSEQLLLGEFEDVEKSNEKGKEGMIQHWTIDTIEMGHLKEGNKPGELQFYKAVLHLFPTVFSKHSFDLGKFNVYDIRLETDNTRPGRQKQRPMREQYWPIIQRKMDEYIKNDIVDISNNPTTFIHNIRAVTLPQTGTSYRNESYASLQQKLRDAQLKPQEEISDLRVTIDFSGNLSLNGSLKISSNTFPNISKERVKTLHCLLSKFDLTPYLLVISYQQTLL